MEPRRYKYRDRLVTVKELCAITGFSRQNVTYLLKKGVPPEQMRRQRDPKESQRVKWVRAADRIKILAAWNKGLCIDVIIDTTECARRIVAGVLPIEAIEEYEKREVLRKYGY